MLDSVAPLLIKTINTRPTHPWRNTEIKKLKRNCRSAERRWRKTNLTVHYEILLGHFKIYNNAVEQARISYFPKLINEHKNNQKFFFSTIDLLTNTNFNRSSKTPTDALCEDFADHFRSKINDIRSSLLPQQILNVDTPRSLILPEKTLESFATAGAPVTTEKPAAAAVAMDQLSAEFAKQRTSLKEDVSTLIQDAIRPIQASLDSLQTTVTSFQSRLTSVESVAGDNFEWLTLAESTIKMLQSQTQSLLDRCDNLENRSRRSNLRVLNIPEGSEDGKDPLNFMSEVLMEAMGPDVFPTPPELERAHRTPTSRAGQRSSPRTFLVCFSRFQQKEARNGWARNHELKYQGAIVRVYQDVSATLAKKRAAFNGVKQALYQKNVRFHLLYLARLRVSGDDVFTFDSTDEAQRFHNRKFGNE